VVNLISSTKGQKTESQIYQLENKQTKNLLAVTHSTITTPTTSTATSTSTPAATPAATSTTHRAFSLKSEPKNAKNTKQTNKTKRTNKQTKTSTRERRCHTFTLDSIDKVSPRLPCPLELARELGNHKTKGEEGCPGEENHRGNEDRRLELVRHTQRRVPNLGLQRPP